MKTNFKKLVVMLGIVLGFTLSAGAIIMGWGYIAESEMHSFQENCSAIPNAYVKTDGKEYVVDGVLSYYGACVCRVGYTYNEAQKACVVIGE